MAINQDALDVIERLNKGKDFGDGKEEVRSFFQGVTLGFADEIEGYAQHLWDKVSGDGTLTYEQARNNIRNKLKAYQKEHPMEAFSYEMLGAFAPTVAAFMTPGGQGVATAKLASLGGKVKQAMKVGSIEGAFAGYGTGEEGAIEDIKRIPGGALMGSVVSGAATPIFHGTTMTLDGLISKARQMFGDKTSDAVRNEVNRIVETTGMDEIDVMQGIQKGQILADNETIGTTLRAYQSDLGKKAGDIEKRIVERAKETKDKAKEILGEGLMPGTGYKNVSKIVELEDEAFNKLKNAEYKAVYKKYPNISADLMKEMNELLTTVPGLADDLITAYKLPINKHLVPIIKKNKKGEVEMTGRMPTLEDAEMLKQTFDGVVDSAFSRGTNPKIANSLKEMRNNYRESIGIFSPELKDVRNKFRMYKQAQESYQLGKKILTKDVDDVEVLVDKLINTAPTRENAMKYRAMQKGALAAYRNKLRKSPNYLNAMVKPETQGYDMLKAIFPREDFNDVINAIRTASSSSKIENRILNATITEPTRKAGEKIGQLPQSQLLLRANQGDFQAQQQIAKQLLENFKGGLNEAQKQQVVDILFSKDPDFVRKALNDTGYLANIQKQINDIFSIGGQLTSTSLAIPSASVGGDYSQGLIGGLLAP